MGSAFKPQTEAGFARGCAPIVATREAQVATDVLAKIEKAVRLSPPQRLELPLQDGALIQLAIDQTLPFIGMSLLGQACFFFILPPNLLVAAGDPVPETGQARCQARGAGV